MAVRDGRKGPENRPIRTTTLRVISSHVLMSESLERRREGRLESQGNTIEVVRVARTTTVYKTLDV